MGILIGSWQENKSVLCPVGQPAFQASAIKQNLLQTIISVYSPRKGQYCVLLPTKNEAHHNILVSNKAL